MSKGIRFAMSRAATYMRSDRGVSVYRYSTAVRMMRERGTSPEALAEFESDRQKFGSACNEHGVLADPVIGIVQTPEGPRVAFACPFCSDSNVLEAWKREGSAILA